MDSDDTAGRSADEYAEALLAKADRLRDRALRFQAGAEGERRTAAVLNPRSGDGWFVLHDLAVPGSPANIDHVVVAPTGIFIVDSKHWSQPPRAGNGTLWVGRYPKNDELATIRWEIEAVRTALSTALPALNLQPQGVISLTNTAPAHPVLTIGNVTAVSVGDLVRHLARRPEILRPDQVEAAATALDIRMASRTGATSSLVRPGTQPSSTRTSTDPFQHSFRPTARTPPPPRRQPRTRSSATRVRGLVVPIAVIVLAIVGLRFLPQLSRAFTPRLPAVTAPKSPNNASSTTARTPQPGQLKTSWSCPSPTARWTATLSWPASSAAIGSWMVQTAPASTGPWRTTQFGTGPAPIKLNGITAGSHEWIRAGTIPGIEIAGESIMQGQLVAPVGC
jgi:hypothetical protein